MSDFKFSCPVCGQNILCDDSYRGVEMPCPSCNSRIVAPHLSDPAPISQTLQVAPPPLPNPPPIPQYAPAPKSATKSVPTPAGGHKSKLALASLICSLTSLVFCVGWLPGIILGHLARARMRKDPTLQGAGMAKAGLIIGYACLAFTVALGIGIVFFASSPSFQQAYQEAQQAQQDASAKDQTARAKAIANLRPLTAADKPAWTLDLANAEFPDHPVSGTIHGKDALLNGAMFRNGDLRLRSMNGTEVVIHALGASIENADITIQPDSGKDTQVRIKWVEDGQTNNATFKSGYAMKLKTDAAVKRKVKGQIYLSLSDDSKSCVGGTFTLTLPKKK